MKQTVEDNPKAVLGTILGAAAGAGIAAAAGEVRARSSEPVWGRADRRLRRQPLDNRDKTAGGRGRAEKRSRTTRPAGLVWRNPDSGNSGSITPTRTYEIANGQYCREYRQTIVIGASRNRPNGTACRQPDGTWQTQS